MKIELGNAIFSTGKYVYVNEGIVGLAAPGGTDHTGGGWVVAQGYDGGFDKLTKNEQIELADYMISLWQNFKMDAEK